MDYELSDFMQFETATLNESAHPFASELPDSMQLEYATLNGSVPAENFEHPDLSAIIWSTWILEAELRNIAAPLIVVDRYSKLLDSLQWFEFAN